MTLSALGLSASTFIAGAASGTVIGAITGQTSGSTLAIVPADTRVAITSGNLVVGTTASAAGNLNVTLRETLAGAANSPRDTIVAVSATIPFLFDTDTHWLDFDYSGNVLDSVGHNTLSIARERIRRDLDLWQPTKARQPLKVTNGIDFNQATNRGLIIDLPTLTNGKNGWYLAGVIQPTTSNVQIMSIARTAGTQLSRMDMLLTSSRNLGFRGVGADGASPAFVIYTAPITLGQVYAFEFLWDFDADTATVWLGGVAQTPAFGPTGGPWSNFPSTNPSAITIGNTIASPVTSFNGTVRQLIFKDGVPDAAQRSSVSAYNLLRAA